MLYGGTPAPRVYLHAAQMALDHPSTGQQITFRAPPAWETAAQARLAPRLALIDPEATNAWRVIHGAADGRPEWYVERYGDYLLSQGQRAPTSTQLAELARLMKLLSARGASHKVLTRHARRAVPALASPEPILGEPPPERFAVRENGLQFEISFREGYSVGLFLDQRDNRRRLLTGYIAPGFSLQEPVGGAVLNTFAYTCGFALCAAKTGSRTTSLDLSRKCLAWGRRNFTLNQLDPHRHEFLCGDAFDWLRRLERKGRRFDLILLDPPTFSRSKESGVFKAQKDYGRLVNTALPLLRPGGVLFASTNAADWAPEQFLAAVIQPIQAARRPILLRHYVPQAPDFPVCRSEPAYLKTVWLRIG